MEEVIERDDAFAEEAGDPDDAVNLPATTGRDTETGEPDRDFTDEAIQ